MKDYQSVANNLQAGMGRLGEANPETVAAFQQLMGATIRPGSLSTKVKELIALAIGITVRCDGCIAHHAKAVYQAGATRSEVVETIGVAILMGGGPSTAYGVDALAAYDQFAGGRSAAA